MQRIHAFKQVLLEMRNHNEFDLNIFQCDAAAYSYVFISLSHQYPFILITFCKAVNTVNFPVYFEARQGSCKLTVFHPQLSQAQPERRVP